MKILTGSKAGQIADNRDLDYLYVDEPRPATKQEGIDGFEITSEELNQRKNFTFAERHKLYYSYLFDKAINPESPLDDYHILDYKKELYELIKETVEKNKFGLSGKFNYKGYILKQVYHIAYNIFILWNDSPLITPEQKAIVQKIHDHQMPIEYLDTLKGIFEQVKARYENTGV